MKVCLIGQNLTNLILSTVLAEKKLSIDLYINDKFHSVKTNRTIAISSDNYTYLKKYTKKNLPKWQTKKIKIYTEDSKSKEIISFENKHKSAFNLVKYSDLNRIFLSKAKNLKNIKFIKLNTSNSSLINKIKNYDLVINSQSKNYISKKYFYNNIKKNYKSTAYTFTIDHNRLNNKIASQIFTKYGPLAFLPISNTQTSIVFSFSGNIKNCNEIIKLFNYYNTFYKVKKISEIEKYNLNFSMLRNYINKNILAFGDLTHRIHPLAGQGFNMTIRDIKNLALIIDKKTKLGLPIDISAANDFQNIAKHKNYLYGKTIDAIYEFFKIDNRMNNLISKPVLKLLNKNFLFKKYSYLISEKGFDF